MTKIKGPGGTAPPPEPSSGKAQDSQKAGVQKGDFSKAIAETASADATDNVHTQDGTVATDNAANASDDKEVLATQEVIAALRDGKIDKAEAITRLVELTTRSLPETMLTEEGKAGLAKHLQGILANDPNLHELLDG